ncbi:MAG: CsgG/HfaB family protein [Bacteroidales bacterium]|jgi:hypothetical protein|nr:CsgG/HfaB family protein [Bacteroidales bacterium]
MKKILVLMLAVLGTIAVWGQTKQTIAIYVTGGKTDGDNKMLEMRLKSAIVKSENYAAVERTTDFLNQLRREQKYQTSGAVDDKQLARLGKESGAKYVCVAEIMPVEGSNYFITARLIDVEKAAVYAVADGSDEIKDSQTMLRMSENVAKKLLESAAANKSGEEKERVAVYVAGGNDMNKRKLLGVKLVSEFTNSDEYAAMERTDVFLEQLQKEQQYQRSGNVNDKQLAELGRQSGVQYVCVAEIMPVAGSDYFITTRLIDIERATVIASADGANAIDNTQTMLRMSEIVAGRLIDNAVLNNFGNEKARVAVYVTGESAGNINKVLGIKLVSAITNSSKYAAMERTDMFLMQLAKEQQYQHSGNVNESQLAKLGKQFGVQYVCAATVNKNSFGDMVLAVSLIDVETAISIATAGDVLTDNDLNALTGATQRVAESLLDNEDNKIPEVEYYPDWFFNHSDDEYVGVSLPLKNTDLAIRQAVYPALLSYKLRNDSTTGTNLINSYGTYDATNGRTTLSSESYSREIKEYRLKYIITKTAKNKYGEIFVAVKILSGKSGPVVKWGINNYISSKGEIFQQQSEIMFQTRIDNIYLKSTCKDDRNSDSFFCKNEGSVADKITEEREYLENNKNYTYQETVSENSGEIKKNEETGEIEILLENSIGQSLDYSLGFAYLMGLVEMNSICSNTGNNIRIEGMRITRGFLEIVLPRSY